MPVTNTYAPVVSQREDLADFIYNIDPVRTPMLQAAEWTTASATTHEWTEDTLANVDADNSWEEGKAKTVTAVAQGTRLGNIAQISRKDYGVTGTTEVISKAGRDSEIALGQAKAMRELKRDMDAVISSADQVKTVAASGTKPLLGPLVTYVRNASRNTGAGTTAGEDPSGDGAFNGGQKDVQADPVRAFTQTLLDEVIEDCWTNGGKPSLLIMGPAGRNAFNTFDGLANQKADSIQRSDRSDGTVYGSVDVYLSGFGMELRAVNSPNLRATAGKDRDAWLIDPEHLKVPFLRSFEVLDFAKVGDSIEQGVLAQYTLEVCNTYAHGLVADIGG